MSNKKEPLHEKWSEYTNTEVNDILLNQCKKNKCPYLRRYSPISNYLYIGRPAYKEVPYYCDYIELAHHSRDCSPDGCTHWRDKNVQRAPFDWHKELSLTNSTLPKDFKKYYL